MECGNAENTQQVGFPQTDYIDDDGENGWNKTKGIPMIFIQI